MNNRNWDYLAFIIPASLIYWNTDSLDIEFVGFVHWFFIPTYILFSCWLDDDEYGLTVLITFLIILQTWFRSFVASMPFYLIGVLLGHWEWDPNEWDDLYQCLIFGTIVGATITCYELRPTLMEFPKFGKWVKVVDIIILPSIPFIYLFFILEPALVIAFVPFVIIPIFHWVSATNTDLPVPFSGEFTWAPVSIIAVIAHIAFAFGAMELMDWFLGFAIGYEWLEYESTVEMWYKAIGALLGLVVGVLFFWIFWYD